MQVCDTPESVTGDRGCNDCDQGLGSTNCDDQAYLLLHDVFPLMHRLMGAGTS